MGRINCGSIRATYISCSLESVCRESISAWTIGYFESILSQSSCHFFPQHSFKEAGGGQHSFLKLSLSFSPLSKTCGGPLFTSQQACLATATTSFQWPWNNWIGGSYPFHFPEFQEVVGATVGNGTPSGQAVQGSSWHEENQSQHTRSDSCWGTAVLPKLWKVLLSFWNYTGHAS